MAARTRLTDTQQKAMDVLAQLDPKQIEALLAGAKPPAQPEPQQSGKAAPRGGQTGVPGQGYLMFEKALGNGHFSYQGPLTSVDGEHLVLRADVTTDGYDVAVYKPSPVRGESWALVDEFKIPPMAASKLGHKITAPVLGQMMASPWITRGSQRHAVRIQLLAKDGRPDQPLI